MNGEEVLDTKTSSEGDSEDRQGGPSSGSPASEASAPAETLPEEVRKNELLFEVRLAVRYHDKLRGHFQVMGGLAAIASFLAGFAMHEVATALVGLVVACFVMWGLVTRASDRAALHKTLKDRYGRIETDLDTGRLSRAKLDRAKRAVDAISEDEPKQLRVLTLICHNEQSQAWGYEDSELYDIKWYQRRLATLCDVPPAV